MTSRRSAQIIADGGHAMKFTQSTLHRVEAISAVIVVVVIAIAYVVSKM